MKKIMPTAYHKQEKYGIINLNQDMIGISFEVSIAFMIKMVYNIAMNLIVA